MKLENIDLSKLLPFFMQTSPDTAAMSDVLSETLQTFAHEIARLATWDRIGQLASDELDELATELNVMWYSPALPDEKKRVLLLNSDKTYMHLGTVYAVETTISDIFGKSRVEEWFNYGGNPHYFRIIVERTEAMSPENEAKLLQTLDYVKRKSQWLEAIINEIETSCPLYIGASIAIHTAMQINLPES